MVRLMPDLDTAPPSRVLGGLVERGILRKAAQERRGPSLTYGPGPRFPQPSGRRRSAPSDRGGKA